MQIRGRHLGPIEAKFFSWAQSRRIQVVRTGDLVKTLGLNAKQEADLFRNMSKSGLIVKLMRGLYLVPERLPPGGKWTPSPYRMLDVLMKEVRAKYQVTGLSAFNFHRLDLQVPIETCVYNTILSGRKKVGGLSFLFIKVTSDRLGGEQILESNENIKTPISSLPRTVFDAIYDYDRFNTLPKAYVWIFERRKDKAFLNSLVEMTVKYGTVSAKRRLGCVLEMMKADPGIVRVLERSLKRTTSFIPLVPVKNPSGTVDRKWGVLMNLREPWANL